MKITTLQYLGQIDHCLENLETGDELRMAEINNIRQPIQTAIRAFLTNENDAETFAWEIINDLRDRIDALAADPDTAGYHEQFRDTIPAPAPDSTL